MAGVGDVCGEFNAGSAKPYKGNLWQTFPSPEIGINATVETVTVSGKAALALIFTSPYDNAGTFAHTDILGYLGFPESGLIQINDVAGGAENGATFHYTSRSHYAKSGNASNQHLLYGVTGKVSTYSSALTRIVSPSINWSSLLTDEVIAGAVEYAITMNDPNSESVEDTSFDCTDMLASDGKTLGEWGVSPTAIRVKAHSKKHKVLPLRHLFEVTRSPDWGLQGGASEDAVIASKHTGGLSNAEKDQGTRLDVGYIPKTVLNIVTKYRGINANTATPILVNTNNGIVSTKVWQQNLRGERYNSFAGDLILPNVHNPMIESNGTVTSNLITLNVGTLFLFCIPASTATTSWGNKVVMWADDVDWGLVRSSPGANCTTKLVYLDAEVSANFVAKLGVGDPISARYSQTNLGMQVDGIRRAGSKSSRPFLYFRGARQP